MILLCNSRKRVIFAANLPNNKIMTRKIVLILSAVILCGTLQGRAQQRYEPYFSVDDLPDAVVWLPAPPDSVGGQFTGDILQYMWGKSIRNTERGEQAVAHRVTEVADMAAFFSEPFGMTISETATPAIFRLLARAIPTFRSTASKPKRYYQRKRPFVRYNESSAIPWEDEELRYSGSYPSGHSIRGFGMALVLCEVNPDQQNALLKLGYEWGQSRVIAGVHWQSDVDASRLMAAGVFARLHTSQAFIADMAAAREEFMKIRNQNK